MSKVYFVSDLHLGHKNICAYRTQFSSQQEHDSFVLENILSCGGKRNTLWMLGDCFFSEESYDSLKEISKAYMQVNWVLGNHDTDNAQGKNNVKRAIKEDLINKIGSLFKYKGYWLSHAPIHPDELRGSRNIHGHVHNKPIVGDDRYIAVCLEQTDYKPIAFEDIK